MKIILLLFIILLDAEEAKDLQWPARCGCSIQVIDGYVTADCSDQPSVDFECLAAWRPNALNLSGNGLQEVPSLLNETGFENVMHLDLSNNKIERLSSWSFGSMLGLISIDLSGNKLTDLPRSVAKIDLVDVSHNNLTDIHSIIGLVNTQAIVKGNPIRCSCRSPIVKRIHETERNVSLDCIFGDSEVPQPQPTQCRDQIIENEPLLGSWKLCIFLVIGTSTIVVAVVILGCRSFNVNCD